MKYVCQQDVNASVWAPKSHRKLGRKQGKTKRKGVQSNRLTNLPTKTILQYNIYITEISILGISYILPKPEDHHLKDRSPPQPTLQTS